MALTVDWLRDHIGLPFGEGDGAVTCWGLVRRVYAARLGVDLPVYGEIAADDLVRVARAMRRGADDGWRAVAEPRPLDVVLMRGPGGGQAVVHVGVMADAARMLHAERATGSVLVPLAHWTVAGRIAGFRRLAGAAHA